jgi:purine-binding chemotaxis protein CheW
MARLRPVPDVLPVSASTRPSDRFMSIDTAPAAIGSNGARRSGKFLTFFLGGEEYGLEILKVHEIISMLPITRIPRSPDYIRGVINLRGKVIPIMDLRTRFSMPATDTSDSCIIVTQIQGVQIGMVVDQVSEVANITAAEVEDTPSFGADVHTEFLLGLAKQGGKVKLLLDIDRVLTMTELAAASAVTVETE